MRRALGKKGVAALFDSLIFLSVVATVSIALLSSFVPHDVPTERSNVDDVHAVLLRCTLPVSEGKNVTMLEAVASSDRLTPKMEQLASSTLSELMPTTSWRWSLRSTQLSFVMGEELPVGCDIHASTIAVGDGALILQAWKE